MNPHMFRNIIALITNNINTIPNTAASNNVIRLRDIYDIVLYKYFERLDR
jgi:hypothetical protein